MKHIIRTLILGGILSSFPCYSEAEAYELTCSIVSSNQRVNKGSRSIFSNLFIDLMDHALSIPPQVIGYTLILVNESGEIYSQTISSTTIELPIEFQGIYHIYIYNKNLMYNGTIVLG